MDLCIIKSVNDVRQKFSAEPTANTSPILPPSVAVWKDQATKHIH